LQIEEGSGEILTPPDFEGINASELKSSYKGKTPKRHIVNTEKRLTRSQAKMRKEFGSLGERVRDESSLGSDSESTTGSMVKLAKESIEAGKVLGIKVIGNEENVLKRITKGLKSQRSTLSIRKAN